MSRNSITTEGAGSRSVGRGALRTISDRAYEFGDGQTPSMNVMKLMVVALAGWINRQQVALLETGGRSVLGTLPPGPKSPGLGEQDHRTRFWIGRGGELPRAAWWTASLLPGCRVKSTTRVFGHYGRHGATFGEGIGVSQLDHGPQLGTLVVGRDRDAAEGISASPSPG